MNRFMFELLGILNNLKGKKKPYSLVSKSVLFSLKQILPILKIFSHIYGYLMMLLLLLVCSFSVVFVSCTEDRHVSVSHYQTSQIFHVTPQSNPQNHRKIFLICSIIKQTFNNSSKILDHSCGNINNILMALKLLFS